MCALLLALTRLRFCYEDDCTKEDPLSQEAFRKLAQPLPYSKQHHSKLVCYITKELMDTENPPLVLPNGYVYSTKVCCRFQCVGLFVNLNKHSNLWLLSYRLLRRWRSKTTGKSLVLGRVSFATTLKCWKHTSHRNKFQSLLFMVSSLYMTDLFLYMNFCLNTCT